MYDNVLQNVVEQLLEDERLRSNLQDEEAQTTTEWAIHYLGAQINAARDESDAQQIGSRELARVRDVMRAINQRAQASPAALPKIFAAMREMLAQRQSHSPAQIEQMLSAPPAAKRKPATKAKLKKEVVPRKPKKKSAARKPKGKSR
ncbi:MAG: hypothetical protein HY327_09605 [Chloroflexi bacterium]|nr:hypothetical protein [Chloroflexota bacterium]